MDDDDKDKFAVCNAPSNCVTDDSWTQICGDFSFCDDNLECSNRKLFNENVGENAAAISSKLWYNEDNEVVIEYTFSMDLSDARQYSSLYIFNMFNYNNKTNFNLYYEFTMNYDEIVLYFVNETINGTSPRMIQSMEISYGSIWR